jgi:ATP-dependent Lhr-like helicase
MRIATGLAALEAEGFALRGRFTPGTAADEWCERRLLARIHHYTIKRLRAEIEPVAARDFLRFLLSWQRVAADARREGPEAVDTVVGQLEGFEAPAGSWESEILPARLAGYTPAWLDDRCLAGHLTWTRLRPRPAGANNGRANGGEGRPSPVRTTPITLLARRHAAHWAELSAGTQAAHPGSRAQAVADYIREHGRRSSMSSSTAPACCAPRWRRR